MAFGSLSHEWLIKFVEHRIADRRILRLIKKWLRAGVSEDGAWSKTEVGTPQGSMISPMLANIYLHYVFDLWVQPRRAQRAAGEVIVVRMRMTRCWASNIERMRSDSSKTGGSACGSLGRNYIRIKHA